MALAEPAGWETVEIDGFTFRRKRPLPPADDPALQTPCKRAQTGSPASAVPAGVSPLISESPALLASPLLDQSAAQAAALQTVDGLVDALTEVRLTDLHSSLIRPQDAVDAPVVFEALHLYRW